MTRPTRRRSTLPSLYGDLNAWALVQADALAFLSVIPDHTVSAVITDPPYGLAFGGEAWDGQLLATADGFQAFTTTWAREIRRVLQPGGYLVSFGAPRTMHRMVAGIEDAGLDVRDQLLWLYGSGVPKGRRMPGGLSSALKPSYEPILLARTPLERGHTLTQHIEKHGTGGLDIEGTAPDEEGRFWPANVVLGHDPDCTAAYCVTTCATTLVNQEVERAREGRLGQPLSRLFYAAKASPAEREAGCEHLPAFQSEIFSSRGGGRPRSNVHPTVKPISLMRWLTRLVAPPGGLVLDPFTGSGTTGCAAVLEGRQFIGIERDLRYVPIARARLSHWTRQSRHDTPEPA